ncbi:MAG: bifunctional phosphopantothenoylcysteine decarboxylase/phosphopantothenate--cysteine ligase CoaBC [Desulfobacterales bacterium]|jgi:phosphopantothenoylcysteine decarboxylase/phosphopantothenate--cysteine ligase|nr:bifunctional phosphopantothenoylcysteine decarboxylase/phosphopantothenate--cysteine ligase CoaBC [Desulfobacterales bacterium]
MSTSVLRNKSIVLGVSGGIAAYKAVELLRLLQKQGADVRVMMTRNAEWFVGPMTFEAISGHPVCTSLFELGKEASIQHIEWADRADAVVVAPATGNIIGKLANGIADDALSTFLMAVTKPLILCPAMNTHMFESRATQRNLATLRSDGVFIIEPGVGEMACGTTGPGRLPEPAEILDRICAILTPKDLAGKKVLVSAGPTQEAIDPVRFISNPSSGKMGYAIARAAEYRGASVTLVAGPTSLPDPTGVCVIHVRSAADMAQAVFSCMDASDVIIKSAAVSDYRPVAPAAHKIKKNKDSMSLTLEKNQDILFSLGQRKKHQVLVGFAAETQDLETYATGKLEKKNLDMIVGNLIGHSGSGFAVDTNRVTFFYRDGASESLPQMSKDEVADTLLDRICERLLT